MKRAWILGLVISVTAFAILINYFIFLERQPEIPVTSICDVLVAGVNECKLFEKECIERKVKHEIDLTICVAKSLILTDENAAKQICSLNEKISADHPKYCFAHALMGIDIERALKECDLIQGNETRAHCRVDTFLAMGLLDKAIEECEALRNPELINRCKPRIPK